MTRLISTAVLLAFLSVAAEAQQLDPVAVTANLEHSSEGEILSVALKVADAHFIYAEQMTVKPVGRVVLVPTSSPEPKIKRDPFMEKDVAIFEDDVTFVYRVERDAGTPLQIEVGYQACNDSLCFLPDRQTINVVGGSPQVSPSHVPDTPTQQASVDAGWKALATSFDIGGRTAGYLKADAFLDFLDRSEVGQGLEKDRVLARFHKSGIWITMIVILLGGLALNLTPCVLPMIPVNIAIIGAGAQAGSRARGFLLGGAYGIGIALVYGILGLVAVVTGAQFGTLNASPVFNLVIAALFLVLALGMFDVLPIDFSRLQSKIGAGSENRGKVATAMLLGGVAALLAGACVAPALISVLILAADLHARGNFAGLVLPFILGVGMALPWPFAGAGLSFLPKPGGWMEWVKRGFGVIILIIAVVYGKLGFSLLAAQSASAREAVVAAQQEHAEGEWLTSLEDALTEAKQQRKPLFVDFWASWCKSCLKMEKTTFREAEVVNRLSPFVKLKYQAEDVDHPDTKAVLDYFGTEGLPTYVLLLPRDGKP
jgi:thiol:disulfide interchange protein DsbD